MLKTKKLNFIAILMFLLISAAQSKELIVNSKINVDIGGYFEIGYYHLKPMNQD